MKFNSLIDIILSLNAATEFPFSMENIPRQKSFACLSLKIGCVISALIIIVYSVLSLAQCTAAIFEISHLNTNDLEVMFAFGLLLAMTAIHTITLALTALMLVGTLREKHNLMRPWVVWTSIQVMLSLMVFIFAITVSLVNHAPDNAMLVFAFEFLTLLLRFYMLMLVASYYKQLEEEMYGGERLKTLVGSDTWYNGA